MMMCSPHLREVMCRKDAKSEEVKNEWGMQDIHVVKDWARLPSALYVLRKKL